MKTVFKIVGPLTLAAIGGCIDFPIPPGPGSSDALERDCPGCTHALSGELMVFVNGRLTSADALFQSNVPLGGEASGAYYASSVYLYDPDLDCDDGTTDCRLVQLGNARLDGLLGELSLRDGSLKKMSLRELAWSPTQGLWATTYDVANDEWGIAEIGVPDWHLQQQDLSVARYAIRPGDPQEPDTDPCYWQEVVSGLGFLGDELLLGVRGMGGVGIRNDGQIFRIALDVLRDAGWCEYEDDISHDPHYYACGVVCEPWANFGPALGVAGDLEQAVGGDAMLSVTRAEVVDRMPLDRQELFRAAPPQDQPTLPVATGVYLEGVTPGLDVEGLARVDGVLYGIDVAARLWRFDEDDGSVILHEDLAPHFDNPGQSLRIRGATRVVIEAEGG